MVHFNAFLLFFYQKINKLESASPNNALHDVWSGYIDVPSMDTISSEKLTLAFNSGKLKVIVLSREAVRYMLIRHFSQQYS